MLNSASFASQNTPSDTFYQNIINELYNLHELMNSRVEPPDDECEEYIYIDGDQDNRDESNNRDDSNNTRDVEEEGTGGDCIIYN